MQKLLRETGLGIATLVSFNLTTGQSTHRSTLLISFRSDFVRFSFMTYRLQPADDEGCIMLRVSCIVIHELGCTAKTSGGFISCLDDWEYHW